MSELLPCPFCGNATNFLARGIDGMPYCGECGAQPGRLDWNTRSDLAQAMIAAAYQDAAARLFDWHPVEAPNMLRALTPDDARAALDAMLAKARKDALREAAERIDRKIRAVQPEMTRRAQRLAESKKPGFQYALHRADLDARMSDRDMILALIDRTAGGHQP